MCRFLRHLLQRGVQSGILVRGARKDIDGDILIQLLQILLRVIGQRIKSALRHIVYGKGGRELVHGKVCRNGYGKNQRDQTRRVSPEAQRVPGNRIAPFLKHLRRKKQEKKDDRSQVNERRQINFAVQEGIKARRNIQGSQNGCQEISVCRDHLLQIRHDHGKEQAGKREHGCNDHIFRKTREKNADRKLCKSEQPHAKESCVALCKRNRSKAGQKERVQAKSKNHDRMNRCKGQIFSQHHLSDRYRRCQDHLIRSCLSLLRKGAHTQNGEHYDHNDGGHRKHGCDIRIQTDEAAHPDIKRQNPPHHRKEQPSDKAMKKRREILFKYCCHCSSPFP